MARFFPKRPERPFAPAGHDRLPGQEGLGPSQEVPPGRPSARQSHLFPDTPEETAGIQTVRHNGLTWVYIERPDHRSVRYLAEHFPQFHPLNLDDVLSRVQRPKIDEYKDHLFMVLHFPVFDKLARVTSPSEVDIFLGQDFLVTIHFSGKLKALADFFKDCQVSEDVRAKVMGQGTGYLFYQVLDHVVDSCFPILNKVLENVEKLEDYLFAGPHLQVVRELSFIRRDIISFRRVIHPQVAVIENLERTPRPLFRGEHDVYFGDIADHMRRIWDGLQDAKEVVEGLSDTINWLLSHRIQETVRVLTVIATLMTPILVITSFYGMNIYLPMGVEPPGSWWGFAVLTGFMFAVTGSLVFYFRRKGWI